MNVDRYPRIREELAKAWFDEGIISSRLFTKPILRHKEACGHTVPESPVYWDPSLIRDLEIVYEAEKQHGQDQTLDVG